MAAERVKMRRQVHAPRSAVSSVRTARNLKKNHGKRPQPARGAGARSHATSSPEAAESNDGKPKSPMEELARDRGLIRELRGEGADDNSYHALGVSRPARVNSKVEITNPPNTHPSSKPSGTYLRTTCVWTPGRGPAEYALAQRVAQTWGQKRRALQHHRGQPAVRVQDQPRRRNLARRT